MVYICRPGPLDVWHMIELVKTSGHVLMSVRANWIPGSMYFNMTSYNSFEFQSTLIAMETLVGDTTLHYTALREEAYYS